MQTLYSTEQGLNDKSLPPKISSEVKVDPEELNSLEFPYG